MRHLLFRIAWVVVRFRHVGQSCHASPPMGCAACAIPPPATGAYSRHVPSPLRACGAASAHDAEDHPACQVGRSKRSGRRRPRHGGQRSTVGPDRREDDGRAMLPHTWNAAGCRQAALTSPSHGGGQPLCQVGRSGRSGGGSQGSGGGRQAGRFAGQNYPSRHYPRFEASKRRNPHGCRTSCRFQKRRKGKFRRFENRLLVPIPRAFRRFDALKWGFLPAEGDLTGQ